MIERIDQIGWEGQRGHVYRYELAADWINEDESVLDVASGIGYGAKVMSDIKKIKYYGADKIVPAKQFESYGSFFSGLDLNEWQAENLNWDISVSFETLEHVKNPIKLANLLKRANRMIILSTPTRPTKHMNPYHLHDFTVDDVLNFFPDCELLYLEDQPSELSHIFVFSTKNNL